MKYALIQEHKHDHSIKMMCCAMKVSRSGYYRWLGRGKSQTKQRREQMTEVVMDTYSTFKASYGAPRITDELNELGFRCSVNYVADILKERGLRARNGKAFNYGRHAQTMNNVSDNLLWRNFSSGKSNEKWTTDITYIWVENQWMYLATVIDLYSRSIVAGALMTI